MTTESPQPAKREKRVLAPLEPVVCSTAARAVGTYACVLYELVGGEKLLKQQRQLYLAVGAANLHVRQHVLEVANVGSQGLHFAVAMLSSSHSGMPADMSILP